VKKNMKDTKPNSKMLDYTWKDFDEDVDKLVRRIRYAEFKPRTIVGIATGGLPLGTKLKNRLKVPLLIISASSYQGKERGTLAFNASFHRPIESPVLIVDDVCDSGQTMQAITAYISSLGITTMTASLLYKECSVFKPDWYLRKTPAKCWIKFCWE